MERRANSQCFHVGLETVAELTEGGLLLQPEGFLSLPFRRVPESTRPMLVFRFLSCVLPTQNVPIGYESLLWLGGQKWGPGPGRGGTLASSWYPNWTLPQTLAPPLPGACMYLILGVL